MTPATPKEARCLTCNYPLRDLAENRCPECGRPFNPADPKSMNLGRTPGPIARCLLRHSGWPTVLIILIATTALLITSGPPRFVKPQIADTLYLLNRENWHETTLPAVDQAYTGAFLLFFTVAAFLTFRFAARRLAQRLYTQPNAPAQSHRRRRIFVLLCLLLSLIVITTAWPIRTSRIWLADARTSEWYSPSRPHLLSGPAHCPIPLSKTDQITALRIGATSSLRSYADRLVTLGLFVQQFPKEAVETVRETLSKEQDPERRALAIHIISLVHDRETAPIFARLLRDPDPQVRAAAADAIDILRGLGLTRMALQWSVAPLQIKGNPSVNVDALLPNPPLYRSGANFDAQTRPTLEQMMLAGPTAEEREAAARAIVNWPPPKYDLRIAEWGVWLADSSGNLQLAQSVLDEIPPFVHRIGNRVDSLADRYPSYHGAITKPIVHITATQPLAIDFQVYIRQGRLSYAYPKPDDLVLSNRAYPSTMPSTFPPERIDQALLTKLDPATLPSMPDLREGYPWLGPPHRYHFYSPMSVSNGFQPTSLGLRWQTLIILPAQAPWMTLPSVPADAKFTWWTTLRQVPSSFIASRGESERFLYYDGPTHAQPPWAAHLRNRGLTLTPVPQPTDPPFLRRDEITPFPQSYRPNHHNRQALFIRVAKGKLSSLEFTPPYAVQPFKLTLPATLPLDSSQTVSAFKSLLTDYGLTSQESDGLINAWRTQFFHTDGQRLLLRLSASDYDNLCPISIKPPPTTLIRLGLVLTEFK